MTVTCPDVSEFQHVLTGEYGRRLLIMRITFGTHKVDEHYRANARAAAELYRKGEIDGVIVYVVPLGDASAKAQYAYFLRAAGAKRPAWMVGVMLDVETWRGTSWAIRGDHSKLINQLGGMLASYIGTHRGVLVYGNRGDLREVVPHRDKRWPVIVASYGSSLVLKQVKGAIGQQYTNGQTSTPSLGGKRLPTSSAPFGRCDHNVFPAFKDAHALVRSLRPTATAPKPVRKPPAKPAAPVKPRPAPTPPVLYPAPDASSSGSIVSQNRQFILVIGNDGRPRVNRAHKTIRSL